MSGGNQAEGEGPILEEVELEAYGKRGEKPPRARRYLVRVDKHIHSFEKEIVTGREILTKAGKTPPERFELHQKLKGGQMKRIGLDESVDLRTPGVERFQTICLDATEG